MGRNEVKRYPSHRTSTKIGSGYFGASMSGQLMSMVYTEEGEILNNS